MYFKNLESNLKQQHSAIMNSISATQVSISVTFASAVFIDYYKFAVVYLNPSQFSAQCTFVLVAITSDFSSSSQISNVNYGGGTFIFGLSSFLIYQYVSFAITTDSTSIYMAAANVGANAVQYSFVGVKVISQYCANSAYPYFNVIDSLCYDTCLNGLYNSVTYKLCTLTCDSNCATCYSTA